MKCAVPSFVSFSFTSAILATHVMRSPARSGRSYAYSCSPWMKRAGSIALSDGTGSRKLKVVGKRRRGGGAFGVRRLVVADRLREPHDRAALDVERDRLGSVANVGAVDAHAP